MLATLVLSSAAACAAGLKQGEQPKPPSHFHATSTLTLVSDYRRNGVTQSDNAPALQGRFEIKHDNGWSMGAFATSMHARRGSNVGVSLFGARRIELGETELSLGATALFFYGGDADPFAVANASVSHPIGPVDATLTLNYAPAQEAIHDADGLNINARVRTPIGRLNGLPLTAAASLGWSEGEFAMGADTKLDWSAGVTAQVEDVEIGLAYVDNDLDDDRGEAGIVLSISRRF